MKRFICSLLVVFTIMSFAGCAMLTYEDTNGETDFSLQTITEEDILRGASAISILSSSVTVNNKTVCKASSMSGVVELFEKRMRNEKLEIIVSCEITKGNARLVLVVNNEIVHEFALNEENQYVSLDSITGSIYLKLAGESAGYSVTYEYN